MLSNSKNDFVIIGQNPTDSRYWIHVRENMNNNPGKIKIMADGKGDIKPTIDYYVKNGYKPENIIYNGQPVKDTFQKNLN